jgi:hypothetical protein
MWSMIGKLLLKAASWALSNPELLKAAADKLNKESK